ncbi:MAG: hypothetical protein M3416_16875 [Acidobacteriota bacterium]|nr:hypothetical protein [Acidobacteriota bacterium]
MGWETRERGGIYYYRKERDGGRVRSVYVGTPAGMGALLARLDSLTREEREERRAERAARRKADRRRDASLDELAEACDVLTTAALLAAGFHTHGRQWRRRRA